MWKKSRIGRKGETEIIETYKPRKSRNVTDN